jgi:hypothetical protein
LAFVLYVYRDGFNGKSTLYQSIRINFPKRVIDFPIRDFVCGSPVLNRPLTEKIFLVRMCKDCMFNDSFIQRANRAVAGYPSVGFIIESNSLPPEVLNCKVVHCENKFKPNSGFNIDHHLEEVETLIMM